MRERLLDRRRTLLRALAAAGLLLLSCGSQEHARWNVVLVSLDTLRADGLGAGGNPDGTSPHLDRLARQGTMFALGIAQSASTLPSHRSMFQARPASLTDDAHPMLAEILREAGWATVGFTGGGNVSAELGLGRGFDRYEEDRTGLSWAVPELAGWLREEEREPFFAFLHSYDVHVPYDPPPPYDVLFFPEYRGSLRGADTRELCRRIRGLDGAAGEAPPDLSGPDRRKLRALYAGGVRHADDWIGALESVLADAAIRDRTLLVVMSDHGEEFWDHGTLLHSHTLFQELVHVPLIVRVPEHAREDRRAPLVAETVRNLDIAPTILEILGLPPVPSHDGTSLGPRLRGEAGPLLVAVSEMGKRKSLLDFPWKFILEPGGAQWHLFDLRIDPGETRNVAGNHSERVKAYVDALSRLGGPVRELSPETPSTELAERLRALGYID